MSGASRPAFARASVLLLLLCGVLAGRPAAAQSTTDSAAPAPAELTSTTTAAAAAGTDVHLNPSRMATGDEQRLLNALGNTRMPADHVAGRVYIPDVRAQVLVQPQGRAFRDFRQGGSRWLHAGLIAVAVGSMALLYFLAGTQKYEPHPEGRRIKRFRAADRFVHWLTSVSFVVLALTGLNLLFGRSLVQPWLGDGVYAALTHYGKLGHNFVGFAFIVGIVAMAFMWLRDNIPSRVDLQWIKKGGGMFSHEHVPADKFNAGQKSIYWIALFGGAAVSLTGVLLMFPFQFTGVGWMQVILIAHSVVSGLMIAVIIGHIYLGSIGVGGSFAAMSRGDVDLNWAKTHHPIWVERTAGRGIEAADPPAGAGARPADAR